MISSCKAIIAILTPSYFKSPECREELMQDKIAKQEVRTNSTVSNLLALLGERTRSLAPSIKLRRLPGRRFCTN